MNAEEIRKYCMAFPEATENLQWGDDLCFKCAPDTFAELIEREDIHPAPYVGRYKWVMLDRMDALGHEELRELIRQSYEMVVAKAPGKTAKDSGAKKSGVKANKKRRAAPKKGKKKR